MVIKILFIIIISILFLSYSLSSAKANLDLNFDSATLSGIEKVNNISNIRDRLFERINVFLKFSSTEKAQYQKVLSEKRLAELVYVVNNEDWNFIEDVSSRYASYQGRLTDTIISNKLIDQKDDLLGMLNEHQKVLNLLLSKMDSDKSFWMLVKHDFNTNEILMKNVQDQLK